MKNLTRLLITLFSFLSIQMHAQTKYTINFTPTHLTVNEDVDTIHVIASIHPAAKTTVGIDIAVDNPYGDWKNTPTTLGFYPGDTVSYVLFTIISHNGSPHIRIHHFGLTDFEHVFINGPDSIFTLTIVDNDSVADAGIKQGISESANADIRIFPNPVHGVLNISTPGTVSGKMNINLYNVEGQLLKAYNFENRSDNTVSMTLPDNAKGLMLLRFENEGSVFYKKILSE